MLQSHPNVLLIVIDALRLDCASRELMPNLNAIADESVRFSQAIAQGISTAPSMTSMLTSTYPLDYGGHWYLADSRKTIAEALKAAGYSTAAIHSNPNVSRMRNFDKGFDCFDENLLPGLFGRLVDHLPAKALQLGNRFSRIVGTKPYVDARGLNRKILDWIEQSARPFFVWTQYMDVHGPYLPHRGLPHLAKLRAETLYHKAAVTNPSAVTEVERKELWRNYQAEVRYSDEQLNNLAQELKERGLWDDALMIVTADHGDEFGEHGLYGHINKPYEELVRVPLVVKPPATCGYPAGMVIDAPVRLVDIMPTILDMAGIEPEESLKERMEGRSLVLYLAGDLEVETPDYIITEKEVRKSDRLRIGSLLSMVSPRVKSSTIFSMIQMR